MRGDPLKVVVMEAFKVKAYQIVGPSWLDEDCFEIVAKMPEGATSDQIPAMLQALLAERFKLAAIPLAEDLREFGSPAPGVCAGCG